VRIRALVDLQNGKGREPGWSIDLNTVTYPSPQKGPPKRRSVRDATFRRVDLGRANDVKHLRIVPLFLDCDPGANENAGRVNPALDDARVLEDSLDGHNTTFDVRLFLLGGLIAGVLGQVAILSGEPYVLGNFRTPHGTQMLQLIPKLLIPLGGQEMDFHLSFAFLAIGSGIP
jgi:hypothetical protein